MVHIAAPRILTSLSNYDITPELSSLELLPVQTRADFKVLLLSYKILTSRAPSYPSDLVRPYVPIGPLHSQGSGLLKVPKVKKTTYFYIMP